MDRCANEKIILAILFLLDVDNLCDGCVIKNNIYMIVIVEGQDLILSLQISSQSFLTKCRTVAIMRCSKPALMSILPPLLSTEYCDSFMRTLKGEIIDENGNKIFPTLSSG